MKYQPCALAFNALMHESLLSICHKYPAVGLVITGCFIAFSGKFKDTYSSPSINDTYDSRVVSESFITNNTYSSEGMILYKK